MKKTNIKRFFVLFCVLACVFSMTACTNTISSDSAKTSLKDMKVNQYASDMVQWAEDMLVYLDQTSDAQIKADGEAAKTLSYVNGKVYVVNMQGMNDKTIEFYNSWVKTREDLGALKSIDKEDVRVSDETGTLCTIAINATYETRTCAFELVIDDDFNLDSGAINPTYTTGEKMEKAVLNTVLGMGTVFIVLIFILPMWMNFLLRTMAWQTLLEKNGVINSILSFVHLPALEIINTPWAIILGMVYNFLPFMVLPIYNVLIKIDRDVINAARDLGASSSYTFLKIILPLSIPGIISGITMVFVPALTTFVISDLLGGGKILLIGNVIEQSFKQNSNWHVGSGLSMVLMVFIIASMALVAKYDKEGEGSSF